jgi:hypothetical protein
VVDVVTLPKRVPVFPPAGSAGASAVSEDVTDRDRGHRGFEPGLEPGDVRLAIDAGADVRGHQERSRREHPVQQQARLRSAALFPALCQ